MGIQRRDFLQLTALTAATGVITGFSSCKDSDSKKTIGTSATGLTSLTKEVEPINLAEREARIEKAQRLLVENKMEALVLDAGTSLRYFTGISWGQSERSMLAIIPARGEVKYVCPGFEEDRLRELLKIGKDVFVWQEDESPYKLAAGILKDAGIRTGTVGMEERLRFFIFDGIRKEASHLNYASGDPISMPCRMFKSPAEIALLQKANDITLAALKYATAHLEEGMAPADFIAIVSKAHKDMGASGSGMVNFAEASALPHGSVKPQKLKKGDIVLMDCGCNVEGYASDISRTVVFGAEPTKRQQEVWDLQHKSQAAGFAAAQLGAPCENVDIAARKVITDAGFGPGYKLPGLPHRTGHGIGMDGHEWGNMVLGNKQLLQPGMCFSIEPTISIPGEFGVRLEDCAYMTEQGVKWFTVPSESIGKPF